MPRSHVFFYDWLAEQVEQPGAVGQLAQQAVADREWPKKRATLTGLQSYLWERDGDDRNYSLLAAAWAAYVDAHDASALTARRPVR